MAADLWGCVHAGAHALTLEIGSSCVAQVGFKLKILYLSPRVGVLPSACQRCRVLGKDTEGRGIEGGSRHFTESMWPLLCPSMANSAGLLTGKELSRYCGYIQYLHTNSTALKQKTNKNISKHGQVKTQKWLLPSMFLPCTEKHSPKP